MESIVFTVSRNPGEGYCAVAEGENYSLVTEGASLDELQQMIHDVVAAYFDDPAQRPREILWRFEAGSVAA